MILVLATVALGVPPGTLVDQVIAVVDKEVVTQSELLIEARLALALHEGEQAAVAQIDRRFLDDFLVYSVNQLLISHQARRLGSIDVADEEVESAVASLSRRFRSSAAYRAFLRRFGIEAETVRRVLRRNLRNERYVRRRLRLRLLGETNGKKLDEQRYQAVLGEWLRELRAAAEIRLLGPDGTLERQ